MFKCIIMSATYTLAGALAFYPSAARADSIPTITVTSASGMYRNLCFRVRL
ncbi:MAG: hypothetical protein WA324_21280 [Bryobacteraceae bacterium]